MFKKAMNFIYRNVIEKKIIINNLIKLVSFDNETFKSGFISVKKIKNKCNYIEYILIFFILSNILLKGTSSDFPIEGKGNPDSFLFLSFITWLYFYLWLLLSYVACVSSWCLVMSLVIFLESWLYFE